MYAHGFTRLQSAPKARAAGSRRRAALRRRPSIESLEGRQLLSTFNVSTDEDSGAGSLRQAIIDSDNTTATPTSPNVISFNSKGALLLIEAQSPLPAITQPTIIGATTKSGYQPTKPVVELVGNFAGSAAIGLDITASGSEVKRLIIGGFNAGGVLIDNASNVTLDHDYLGVDQMQNLTSADPNGNPLNFRNGTYGVTIQSENFGAATGNVLSNDIVSGTDYNGIILSGSGTTHNVVEGDFIGTDLTGMDATDDPPRGRPDRLRRHVEQRGRGQLHRHRLHRQGLPARHAADQRRLRQPRLVQ